MSRLTTLQRDRLTRFCSTLINQQQARTIVEPQAAESGFWFGGGNMIQNDQGELLVVGRFRNAGDSRTGVALGTRGLELAILISKDGGQSFQRLMSWDKAALNCSTGEVLSIEGCCLRQVSSGYELYVSTEKQGVAYPDEVADFLKPGAGVWSIDVVKADSLHGLISARVEPLFESRVPSHLHVKDPFFWKTQTADRLGFCSHPFGWSSSNTCIVDLPDARDPEWEIFPRGTTWDVAMTRGTAVLPVPQVGAFEGVNASLLFYCGGECLRPLDEHSTAVKRPRGYSCEEIGGAAVYFDDDICSAERLSDLRPMFISPYGTGCSRYVDVLATDAGFYATWQQSQPDLSQPLVMNFVDRNTAESML